MLMTSSGNPLRRYVRHLRRALPLLLLLCHLPAQADPDFFAFLTRFRAALTRNDASQVADLIRLPFLYEGRNRDRAGFVRIYPELFTPSVRACLAKTATVEEDDARVIFCGPLAFYFRRNDRGWHLAEFGADGEEAP